MRDGSGAGPFYLWSAVYEAVPPAITDARLERLARDATVVLSRSMVPLDLSDWDELHPPALGEFARVYGFEFRAPEVERPGGGALAAFSHGNLVTYLGDIELRRTRRHGPAAVRAAARRAHPAG